MRLPRWIQSEAGTELGGTHWTQFRLRAEFSGGKQGRTGWHVRCVLDAQPRMLPRKNRMISGKIRSRYSFSIARTAVPSLALLTCCAFLACSGSDEETDTKHRGGSAGAA